MTDGPVIGITAWRRSLPTFLGEKTDLYTLGREYVDSVLRAGAEPLIIPRARSAPAILDALDGLILSGGDDVHPSSYGDEVNDASVGVDLDVDRWEIALIREAARRHMPVLGICRGMQIMAVAFGGRMVQDLSEHNEAHDIYGRAAEDILAERHPVFLESGSRLAAIYGENTKPVNTIHHQAVIDPGRLRASARGPAGLIEAVEDADGWDAIGVQWHPEKMNDKLENRLFYCFAQAANAFAQARRSSLAATP
ncbi:MAG: gamma-glutamyl-gamma-aminobutyrate hydrolase family protein [Chloroflexota bacterium]